MTEWALRDYDPADETYWLRCRVLAFLGTAYYDDVATSKPEREAGLELVAVADEQVIGLLDASVTGNEATIETIAVHPDHRRLGVATRLLDEICARLQTRGVVQVDAWTRDDEETLAWYRSHGFEQAMRYSTSTHQNRTRRVRRSDHGRTSCRARGSSTPGLIARTLCGTSSVACTPAGSS